MAEQEIILRLGADISSFQSAMDTVRSSMQNTSNQVESAMQSAENSVTQSAGGIREALKGIAGAIATAFAVDKIIDFGKNLLEVTADAQALESQYEQVMGDMKGSTDKYLKEMGKSWNKHPKELKSAYMQYVALLKSKGVSEEEAHKLSKQYLERTVDANAFANEDMADTTARFMGAIKGEYDSLDTAMVNLSATMLNDIAVEQYGKKFDKLTVEQQETLKMQEALRQHTSAGVFGQGVNEADSYANNLAMVKNTWSEMLAVMGSPVLQFANDALKGLSQTLTTIKTEGFTTALRNIIPSEFHGVLELASKAVGNFKTAFEQADWSSIGSSLGTGLGLAIQSIQGLGQVISDKFAEQFNSIDWAGLVDKISEGVKSFAVSFTSMFNKDLAEAIKSGDMSEVGKIMGDIIISGIKNVASRTGEFIGAITGIIMSIFSAIDWAQLGKDAFQFAISFILGFVTALLDPIAWLEAIANNWEPLLMLIIGLLFAPASWLGKIGTALAKIPFVGKMLEWLWNGFAKLITPISTKIDEFFTNLGKNFVNGWKRMFDEGTVLGDWLGKVGKVFTGLRTWITTKLGEINTKFQVWADKAGEFLAKPFKWVADKAGGFLETATGHVRKLWDKVSEFVGKIKDKVVNMFTGIKIPKISLEMGTKTVLGKSVSYPKGFNISWHKEGGIFNDPSLIGIGESGSEAVIPLSNKSHVRPFARAVAELMPKNNIPQTTGIAGELVIHVNSILDGKELARNTIRLTQDLLADLTKKQNRLNGMYA